MSGKQNSKLRVGQRVLVKHLNKIGVVVGKGTEVIHHFKKMVGGDLGGYRIRLENGEEWSYDRQTLKTIK